MIWHVAGCGAVTKIQRKILFIFICSFQHYILYFIISITYMLCMVIIGMYINPVQGDGVGEEGKVLDFSNIDAQKIFLRIYTLQAI